MNKKGFVLLGITVGLGASSPFIVARDETSKTSLTVEASATQGRSSISGFVFDPSRRPLPDVYVELLSDVYSTIGRVKTSGSGRYTFSYLTDGNYKVRVLPQGTDLMEQVQDITIANVSITRGGGAENAQLDFYLKSRVRSTASPFAAPTGVVFAQEVPEAARKLYEAGINNLKDNQEQPGFDNLKKALEVFPTYYLALDRLGTEYVTRGHHEAARVLLTRAVEVNARSYSSVYALGLAQYHLNLTKEAVENLRRATTLYGKSAGTHLWLGLALKRAKELEQAEAAFRRAKELSKDKVAEVHWQMARLFSEQKRYPEAVSALELLLKNPSEGFDTEKIKRLIQQLREKAATR